MDNKQQEILQDWLEVQKQHWQNLLNGEDVPASDWSDLTNTCHQIAEQLLPQSATLVRSMTDQAKEFSRYGEHLLKALSAPDSPPDLEEIVFEFGSHVQDQTNSIFFKQLELPDHLSTFLSSLGADTLSLPGFPFIQEGIKNNQAHLKKGLQQAEQGFKEFRNALSEYIEIQKDINRDSCHQLLTALKEGDKVESLSELHSLWAHHYERCYHQHLHTPAYQATYGRLSNASLMLKKLNRQHWEREYLDLGLVPLKEYTQLLERHHDLRKTVKKNTQQIEQLKQQLRQETDNNTEKLQQLEHQIQSLMKDLPSAQTAVKSNSKEKKKKAPAVANKYKSK
ncbi:poly(R)-hydroxyalkanoic acid synthase subunit PhaE [Motiliproteus sp. MSK22-1]|uniref:poly(R)-hydroxyalkanoic acid synthase subunit PhaE n=1 Tax=Motiliproteus sp. MSK22-1 TaxID=1897630 RepID=UPI000976FF21|nr:poly(R)-hydroxyalkanoic acid synthase subunit PhaE [Motiliproteus sp. MSK22-1]OMH38710.1 hypothetical protein BGP75_05830 [Motiliproteus sp. MSK22-1]